MARTADSTSGDEHNPDAAASDPQFDRLHAAARDWFSIDADETVLARAPGRVNLIGDHTDYNDGFVLPATINRAVYIALRRRSDSTVRVRSLEYEETVEFSVGTTDVDPYPEWARYVMGVAAEINEGADLPAGFEAVAAGTVPVGAGLSSSAALEIATGMGLEALFDLDVAPATMARLCQRVEHEYVGVECGIMDQMAARLGRTGHALFLDCRSLEYEHIPLPLDEASLLIADTGVSRELASSKYNERRAECEEAVSFFQRIDPAVEALRDVTPGLFEQHKSKLPEPIRSRCRHVVTENERVRQSAMELKRSDPAAVGTLMSESHASLRDDYEVSSPELDCLVEAAQHTDGVFGARMTGAGFGGCIVCLAAPPAVPAVKGRLTEQFSERFGRTPTLFLVESNLEATTLRRS